MHSAESLSEVAWRYTMDFKIVFGLKDGRSVQKEVKDPESQALLGKRIGAEIKGDDIGFPGYTFKITGGSDRSGTPMRWDIEGVARRKVFTVSGIGVHKMDKGMRQRKSVAGNTIGDHTAQVNMQVTKEGKEPLIPKAAEETPAK